MPKIKLYLIALLSLLLGAQSLVVRASPTAQTTDEEQRWIDVSLGPQLIDWFNLEARPGDIARIENIDQLLLLDRITAGRKLVIFKSVADAEEIIPEIADQLDIIGYNVETGPANPPDELTDPVGSVKRMRELADAHDLQLALGPDRRYALSHGVAMAPYADIFILQVQRVQEEPDTVRNFVEPLVRQLREANPDLEIGIQVRTDGDVIELADLIFSIREELNGVSMLTSPETVDTAARLVEELRTREIQLTAQPIDPAAEAESSAPTVAAESAAPELVLEENAAALPGTTLPFTILLVGAFLAGGVVGGLLVGVAMRSRQVRAS